METSAIETLKSGLIAGFIATIVLSVIKAAMDVIPQLDVAAMIAGMMGTAIGVGWIIRFRIGTVAWGGGFALVHDRLSSGGAVMQGVVFGILAWLAMMIMIMPTAGAGLFGMARGPMAPVMTLVLHIIFGVVLGATFHRLTG